MSQSLGKAQIVTIDSTATCVYSNTPETFIWLYDRYWSELVRLAIFYVKDHDSAEEIVQQLFIDIFQKQGLLKVTGNVDAYLRTAIKNRSLNYLLKQKRYTDHLKKWGINKRKLVQNEIEEGINLVYVQNQIYIHLSRLNDSCREVFLLNRDRQMTIQQIAKKLQRPPDTVAKQLGKAVRYLYKCCYEGQNN